MAGNEHTYAKNRVLIVDDDEDLTRLISKFLTQNDLDVDVLHDGDSALASLRNQTPDLVVLDIMLPGTDGLSVCKALREFYAGPVIMLTALDDDIDQVVGLEVGADDYLVKPVKPRVLLAHIRALLRRVDQYSAPLETSSEDSSSEFLRVDSSRREVWCGDKRLELTSLEFDVLHFLYRRAGLIVGRDEIYREVFHLEYDGLDRSLDLCVSRLRRKIGDDAQCPDMIKTVRARGYLLAV